MSDFRVLYCHTPADSGSSLHNRLGALGYAIAGNAASLEEAIAVAPHVRADVMLIRVREADLVELLLSKPLDQHRSIPYVLVYAANMSTNDVPDDEVPWLREPVGDRELKYAIELAVCRHRNEASLRAEQERLVSLSAASPAMIYTFKLRPDGTSCIPYASSACQSMYGVDPEEVRDNAGPIYARIHPDDLRRVQKSVEDSALGMTPWHCAFRVQHPHKGEIWLEGSSTPLRDSDGSVVWHGVILDVTERKKAESALHMSEARFRTFVESAPEAVFVQTRGCFSYLNPAALELFQVSAEQLLGRPVYEIFHPDFHPKLAERIHQLNELRLPVPPVRERIIRADGTEADVEVLAVPYSHQGENGALVFARDITERTRAEAALRANKERLKLALRVAHMGVWEWDLVNDHVHLSPEIYSITGLEHYDGKVQSFLDVMHPDDVPGLMDRVNAAIRSKATFSVEFRVVRPDGSVIWASSIGRETEHDSGIATRVVGILQDITDRKHAEEERATLEAQLLQAQKMESVGRLAGGVAHDFNNMLSVIVGHAELALLDVEHGSSLFDDLHEILAAANRSADLTRQLLAYARKQTIAPRVLNLNETIEATIRMLRRLMGEDINVVWAPGDDLWKVNMDPSQIDQILANLAVNARDAIAGSGVVTLETRNVCFAGTTLPNSDGIAHGDYVMLGIRDTGAGMSAEVRDRLFEPFFTTKEIGKGTGLGLATVYGIIKQNKGIITVDSEAGRGTTFTMYLPRCIEAAAENEGEIVPTIHRGTETILFVEDESAILSLGKQMLESLGYTVLATMSPAEALHLAKTNPDAIDLLLTDVIMPEMNGRDLARALTALYPGMRHMFMSGYTADVIAESGVLDDGVCFLHKPFSIKTLAQTVRRALGAQ